MLTIHIAIEAETLPDLLAKVQHALGALPFPPGATYTTHPSSGESAPSDTDPPAPDLDPAPAEASVEASVEAEADAPKRKRRTKAEMQAAAAETPVEKLLPAADETPAMSAAEAAEVVAPAARTVASWSEGGQACNLSREEVLDVARAFIASHPQGKDRAAAVIKGIAASHGFGKLSDVPDDLMQDVLDAINEARS